MHLSTAGGVNLAVEHAFSAFAADAIKETWNNSPFLKPKDFGLGHFRGPKAFRNELLYRYDDVYEEIPGDGQGPKRVLTATALKPEQAGQDILAMACGDITRYGGIPLAFTNILDVQTLGELNSPTYQLYQRAIKGLCDAATKIKVALFKGETAELGPLVGVVNKNSLLQYNWAGVAYGVYREKTVITGSELAPGQVVMALRERGLRSNGASFILQALTYKYGERWWENPDCDPTFFDAASKGSELYDLLLTTLNGWYEPDGEPLIKMYGMAHITGGGMPEKFGEALLYPLGLSANLRNPYEPPLFMRLAAQWTREYHRKNGTWMPEMEHHFYDSLHGGQGELVIIDRDNVTRFRDISAQFGHESRVIGEIYQKKGEPELVISSRFETAKLTYKPKK